MPKFEGACVAVRTGEPGLLAGRDVLREDDAPLNDGGTTCDASAHGMMGGRQSLAKEKGVVTRSGCRGTGPKRVSVCVSVCPCADVCVQRSRCVLMRADDVERVSVYTLLGLRLIEPNRAQYNDSIPVGRYTCPRRVG